MDSEKIFGVFENIQMPPDQKARIWDSLQAKLFQSREDINATLELEEDSKNDNL